jgi:RNA polymerase sigma-70 factor (ECF subfamily)
VNCLLAAWERHERELRAFLRQRAGDPQLADDLLQDVFLKALAQGGRFCELGNPRAWLFRVARNRLVDHLRAHKTLGELPPDLPAETHEPEPLASLAGCLPRALAEMPEQDREALTLCDLEGLPQAEYARRLGLSLPAAKSRVQRARKRLGEHLKTACQVRFDETGRVCCFVPRDGKTGPA